MMLLENVTVLYIGLKVLLQTYTGFHAPTQLEKCNEERCNEKIAKGKDKTKKDARHRSAMRIRMYARIFTAKYDI